MKKSSLVKLGLLMLMISIAFIPTACAQTDSTVKQINIDLNKEGGVLLIPIKDNKITDIKTTLVSEKTASASLSGTIDDNNLVLLKGIITLGGKEEKVTLSGEATQVFIGWNVPEGAKPIYSKVDNITMTRYEGSTKRYATYVNVKDTSGKYCLHGEFYEDGNGGL